MKHLLTEYFSKGKAQILENMYNITTVEEAQQLTDQQLTRCREIGPGFVKLLREIKTDVNPNPPAVYRPAKKDRISQLNIHGLNPRQVNAFRKLMESGRMAEFVNQEYFSDMFKHDAITTIPTVVNTGRTHVTHVYYK